MFAFATSSLPLPAATVLIRGWCSSFGLENARMSASFSFGSSSASAIPSIDLPVPGSPINNTCLLCCAAFLTISQAWSCPITCSIIFSGTLSSAVLLKSSSLTIPAISDENAFIKVMY